MGELCGWVFGWVQDQVSFCTRSITSMQRTCKDVWISVIVFHCLSLPLAVSVNICMLSLIKYFCFVSFWLVGWLWAQRVTLRWLLMDIRWMCTTITMGWWTTQNSNKLHDFYLHKNILNNCKLANDHRKIHRREEKLIRLLFHRGCFPKIAEMLVTDDEWVAISKRQLDIQRETIQRFEW